MSRYYLRHCSRGGKTLRITISLEKTIEPKLQELQKSLRSHAGDQWSMSKVINMLLLSGLLAHNRLGLQDWYTIKGFVDGYSVNFEVDPSEFIANLAALDQNV